MDINRISINQPYIGTFPISRNEKMNFRGGVLATAPDSFVRNIANIEFNKHVDVIMSKIVDKTHAFTPEKLEKIITNAQTAFPNFKEEEVLTTLQRLTQWADYTCMNRIAKLLKIGAIQEGTPINNCFNYFQHYKKLFPTDFMGPKVVLVTEDEIPLIQRIKDKEVNYVNLEGFSQGVNLFTSNNNLEGVTLETLKKVQAYQAKYPQTSFDDALYAILNGKIIRSMRSQGHNVETVRLEAPATRETILEQMQPFNAPTREEVINTLQTTAKHFTNNPKDYETLRGYLADFYATRLEIFTKEKILEKLGQFKEILSKHFTDSHYLSEENSYLLIPKTEGLTKSYDVITQMYAAQNNILPHKIVYIEDVRELNKFPKNSTFILLDDMAVSGNAMSTISNYHKHPYDIKPDKHILFCPITAHENGINHINYAIDNGRHYIDEVITLPNSVKPWKKTDHDRKFEDYFIDDPIGNKVYGYEGFRVRNFSGKECIVFPYMTPDNNPDLASFITHFFLPSNEAIKNKHLEFYDIIDAIKKANTSVNNS